ncbi:MAG: FAD-dependent oxidoreductase, partial [Saprospiraceae bacterium]
VQGPKMMEDFQKQAQRFQTDIKFEIISKVDFTGPVHKIWSESGDMYQAHTIIISSGASAKWLGLESEKRLMNRGVSACAVCDGFFFRGMPVAVVGAGDTAAEEASYLAKLCPEVHLLVRKDSMRASKIMQERVLNNPKIIVHWNTETLEVLGNEDVESIKIVNNKTKEISEIQVKAFFVAIGHQPNSGPFMNWIDMDEQAYIKTIPGSTRTNRPGVFACGDVQDRNYRQAVTAAGTGCMAALDAERYLVSSGVL